MHDMTGMVLVALTQTKAPDIGTHGLLMKQTPVFISIIHLACLSSMLRMASQCSQLCTTESVHTSTGSGAIQAVAAAAVNSVEASQQALDD